MHVLKGPTDKKLRKAAKGRKAYEARAKKKSEKVGKPTLSWEQVQGVDKHQYLKGRAKIAPKSLNYYANFDDIFRKEE